MLIMPKVVMATIILRGFHKPIGDMEPVSSCKFNMGKIGILKKPDALKTIK